MAWIPSTDGKPPSYPHPCIYLDRSSQLVDGVVVLGMTSDPTVPRNEYTVEMPWQPGKHPRTGLDRPTLAIATWTPHIDRQLAKQVIGFTQPNEQRVITKLLQRRLAALRRQQGL